MREAETTIEMEGVGPGKKVEIGPDGKGPSRLKRELQRLAPHLTPGRRDFGSVPKSQFRRSASAASAVLCHSPWSGISSSDRRQGERGDMVGSGTPSLPPLASLLEQRIRLLERRVYLRVQCKEESRPAYRAILKDSSGGGGRIERTSREEEEKAREVAKVPGSLFTDLARRSWEEPSKTGRLELGRRIEGSWGDKEEELIKLPVKAGEEVQVLLSSSVEELDSTEEFETKNPFDVHKPRESSIDNVCCTTSPTEDFYGKSGSGDVPLPTLDLAVNSEIGGESIDVRMEVGREEEETMEVGISGERDRLFPGRGRPSIIIKKLAVAARNERPRPTA